MHALLADTFTALLDDQGKLENFHSKNSNSKEAPVRVRYWLGSWKSRPICTGSKVSKTILIPRMVWLLRTPTSECRFFTIAVLWFIWSLAPSSEDKVDASPNSWRRHGQALAASYIGNRKMPRARIPGRRYRAWYLSRPYNFCLDLLRMLSFPWVRAVLGGSAGIKKIVQLLSLQFPV